MNDHRVALQSAVCKMPILTLHFPTGWEGMQCEDLVHNRIIISTDHHHSCLIHTVGQLATLELQTNKIIKLCQLILLCLCIILCGTN